MIKLYRSAQQPGKWVAYIAGSGWVVFPARENGWHDRRPARGLDPIHLREVPLSLAGNAAVGEPEPDLEWAGVA